MQQSNPCTTTTEPTGPRACALQQEEPPQEVCSLQLKKLVHGNEAPVQPKVKNSFKKQANKQKKVNKAMIKKLSLGKCKGRFYNTHTSVLHTNQIGCTLAN